MDAMHCNSGGGSEDPCSDASNMVHQRVLHSFDVPNGHHLHPTGEQNEHKDWILLRPSCFHELGLGDLHDDLCRDPGQHCDPNGQTIHRKCGRAHAAKRMGVGRFLAVPALAAAALVEMWRLRSIGAGHNLSIAWQLPQFMLIACSDVFCGIAQLEFFYSEAPMSMRSLCSAFSFLAMSLGYYLNSMTISAIAALSKSGGGQGWLPADLNDGHLDYYFWLWAGIGAVNFVVYTAFAKNYTVKKVEHR
ncbi:hypothetical protein CFC21_006835 [Triticum aestivum]|uniref:Uncharacterized protein n=2 Tax=Triticum aestivum TaxID=4565 RepID=A0A9R1DD03_WHEAT|nr:hypothetical protein CFC21_006835 [Triticum aestivum]